MNAVASRLEKSCFAAGMAIVDRCVWRPFRKALDNPRVAQASLLSQILKRNETTAYGQRHGFDRIDGLAAYRDAVPPADYEALRPSIMTQAVSGSPELTHEPPVFYSRTSGTTGAAKLVPMTASGFRDLRDTQRLFALGQYRHTETFAGQILAIVGPTEEDRTARGVPIGSATGAVYAALPGLVRRRYVLPPAVMAIADYNVRNYVISLLGLAAEGISCLATANPLTLLRLHDTINDQFDALLDDLASGYLSCGDRLTAMQRQAIAERLQPMPVRARALRRLAGAGRVLSFADIWPGLRTIANWTGGSCGYALDALRDVLPPDIAITEIGYHASECRGTINVDPRVNACVPAIASTVFEFVERDAYEAGSSTYLAIDEIEENREYYGFVTTQDGLYRYDMNDILRVTGRVAATPTLAFVRKGRGMTSITGEKISEEQVTAAVSAALARRGIAAPFFLLLADEAKAIYRLFIELDAPQAVADGVDAMLMESNIEYAAKRRSGRLRPIVGVALRPGSGEEYRRHCVAGGQRDAQFKIMHLQYSRQVDFNLAAWVIEAAR